jgi:alpha-beta hydrolase superfamily lysophospholipase
LSSPLYRIQQQVPQWKRVAATALPKVAPLAPVPIDIVPDNLSNNPENNAAYMADELNLFSISARFGNVFLSSVDDAMIKQAISSLRTNVTIAFAQADRLVDPAKTRSLLPLFPKNCLNAVEIEGAGHEIFNEIPQFRSEAFKVFADWIDKRGRCG